MQETILILDFGSQYTQLIARRIRELNVYCEIYPFNKIPPVTGFIKGVVLSGSPFSVNDVDSPVPDLLGIRGKIPILAICYGAQYLAKTNGGEVIAMGTREYGRSNLSYVDISNKLMKGISQNSQVWMSHGDTIVKAPINSTVIASTADIAIAGFAIREEKTFGIQFHPEVYHTTEGTILLENFIAGICGCSQSWTPESFVDETISALKIKLGKDKVVLGLSGGVDSSVAGVLLQKSIGDNLYCIFVDNGLLRKDEFVQVLNSYQHMHLNVKGVNAADKFFYALKGVSDPEKKRKIIGKTFIDVFEEEAKRISGITWLAQGTIYPDVIESISVNGPSSTIKSHHNVGGLPEHLNLKIVEPLNCLFKDEVRKVGLTLGMNPELLGRHPFPGPGLGVRILGDITMEKVLLLQEVDDIFIRSLQSSGLYDKVWQAFAV
jgi:GMP synthase (glutamine-hydrolysing)